MVLKSPNSRVPIDAFRYFGAKRLVLALDFRLLGVFFAVIQKLRTRSIGKDLPKVTNLLHFSLTSATLVP